LITISLDKSGNIFILSHSITKEHKKTQSLSSFASEKMSDNQQPTSSAPTFIWFQLIGSDGQPYKGTSATKVYFNSPPDVDQFRDAVKAKYNDSHLKGVASSNLKVYENKSVFLGKEEPLKSSVSLDGVGKTEEEALIVIVPSYLQKPIDSSHILSGPTFIDNLKKAGIDRPKSRVLATIANRYPQQAQVALSIGSPEVCFDLYQTVKDLPSSFTRGVIQNDMMIAINGPMSLSQPNILI
jgi:hypothetical protein